MEVIKSHHYGQEEDFPDFNLEGVELPKSLEEQREAISERTKVLRRVEAVTGLKFDVIVSGVDSNIAAMVETDTGRTYISESVLDPGSAEFAIYAGHHEAEHKNNRVYSLNLKRKIEADQIAALQGRLSTSDLPSIDLVEGFNDLITMRKHGRNAESGYVDKEVPAAEKLENLCMKITGKSLVEAFESGNKFQFYHRLASLSDQLLLRKALKRVIDTSIPEEMHAVLVQRVHAARMAVNTQEEAEKLVMRMLSEEILRANILASLEAQKDC
ncbi:hypothetical protein ACFL2V_06510 [Pseudomonadota bacterium]